MCIPGRIDTVSTSFFNADRVTVEGIDVDVRLTGSLTSRTQFDLAAAYTYLRQCRFDQGFASVSVERDFAGETAFIGALPEHRGIVRLTWSVGKHQISASANYAGRLVIADFS